MSRSGAKGRAPNDEQRAALEVGRADVALSAGAGCGKTTVLTARFLGHLERRRPLGQLVALTFTEKAARELRDRVRRECRGRLDDADAAGHWRGVLRGLEAAPIGTFHGYCFELLRRLWVEAGLDPAAAVLDDSLASSLRDEALDGCLRRWLAERNEDLVALGVEYGLDMVREALAGLVGRRGRGDLAAWAKHMPEDLVEVWRRRWVAHGRPALLRGLVAWARPTLDLLARHRCEHPTMRERQAFLLEHFERLPEAEDPESLLGEIRERAKVQGGGGKAHWPSPEIYEDVSEALKDLRARIDRTRGTLAWDEAVTREAAGRGVRFARLAAGAVAAYDRAKREGGWLDFDDLLLKARDLVADSEACRGLAEGIAALMVDEFQDTDPIQGQILRRLAPPREGRLFLVGDVKQSIYRFRGAEPGVFRDFREEFPEEGRHALTRNYRSVPGIIHFVNALFEEIYEGNGDRLVPERAATGDAPPVEFLWADEPDPGAADPRMNVAARRRVEARWIARLMARRLDEGWTIRDRDTGRPRKAKAGDVVLLFRTLNSSRIYEEALAEAGLDYHVVGGSAYYAQQEVQDLINVLSALDDPLDAVALAAALRSPFFGLSDDALYWVAAAGRGDLARGLGAAAGVSTLPAEDRLRVSRAHALLDRWRGLKDRVPIAALVDRVLDESGYEAALPAEFLGGRKRANARKLVRLARRFDARGGFALADFVARLRADLRTPPREEQAATTDEQGDAVRLYTIHQAKGLEFPIVVLPDLNREGTGEPERVAFHPELGPLVNLAAEDDTDSGGKSLGWILYRALEAQEEAAEALRLFYVATTRAQDALILSAGMAADEPPKSEALKLLARRFDRATGAPLGSAVGWAPDWVRVTNAPPPEPANPRRSRARVRPDLPAIVRALRAPAPAPMLFPPPPVPPPRPSLVRLDPAIPLGPTAARVDRLVRSLLADPHAFEPGAVASLAPRLARRQGPAAPARIVAEALARLYPRALAMIRRALAADGEVLRAWPWALAWPPGSAEAITFEGTCDFLAAGADGRLVVLNVADPAVPEVRERLRLRLSARAAEAAGLGVVSRGWLVQLGPEAELRGEESFDGRAIEEAIAGLLGVL